MRANLPCIFSGSNGHVPPLIEDGCGVKLPREIRGNELKSPSRAVFSFPARRATTTNHKPPTCTTPRTNNDADTTPPVIVNRNAPLDTSPSTLTPKFVNHAVLLINSPPPPSPPPATTNEQNFLLPTLVIKIMIPRGGVYETGVDREWDKNETIFGFTVVSLARRERNGREKSTWSNSFLSSSNAHGPNTRSWSHRSVVPFSRVYRHSVCSNEPRAVQIALSRKRGQIIMRANTHHFSSA